MRRDDRRQSLPSGRGRDVWALRMKDLCAQTGLTRQAVHFYIREGLVAPGRKTSANSAVYGSEHIRRLQLIIKLRTERFLPLAAIRALLEADDERLTGPQRAALAELRTQLGEELPGEGAVDGDVLPIDFGDLRTLIAVGAVRGDWGDGDALTVPPEEVEIVKLVGAIRASGLRYQNGFVPEDLLIYVDAVEGLVRKEAALLEQRIEDPVQRSAVIEAIVPLVGRLLAALHESRLREVVGEST